MDLKKVMQFLAKLYPEGNCNHGVIAVARSALSAIWPRSNGFTFDQYTTVSQMMK